RDGWKATGWERGVLGYPSADRVCGLPGGGCRQQFAGGVVSTSPATGTQVVRGALLSAWNATGGEAGTLGYATAAERCGLVRSGCFQVFQNGSVYWSPTTGAHPVSGPIRDAWKALQWERGPLGYPTGDPVVSPTEITQRFEGGTLVQNRSTGQVTRR
ncbi:LGFP repeat-containing protein, partial [Blastococcus sp. SYSU D00813]